MVQHGVRLGLCTCLVAGSVAPSSGAAISREEALALAFPAAEITAERIFLTADQTRAIEARSGETMSSGLVARYVATHDGTVVGRAYLDTHVVRTKKESLLISLDAVGAVLRIDVTAFLEPREYEAPEPWMDQYRQRTLTAELDLRRAIRPIAGATLTARATNGAVRRVLAIDEVLAADAQTGVPR